MSKRSRAVTSLSLCVSMISLGCGGGGGETSTPAEVGQLSGTCSARIYQGTTCPIAKGPVAAVIGLNKNGRIASLCSGTFLSKRHVLTAAHCVPSPSGENAILSALEVAVDDSTLSAPVTSVVHPKYSTIAENAINPFDVAVLTLAQEVDVATLPLIASQDVEVGSRVALYGYGDDETNKSAIERGSPLTQPKRADVILKSKDSGVLLFGSSSQGSCSGDSGGPAVTVSSSGTLGVIGIASSVLGSGCSSASISVDEFDALVGGLTDELRQELMTAFPDGMVPRNAYVDVQSSEVLDFIVSNASDAVVE